MTSHRAQKPRTSTEQRRKIAATFYLFALFTEDLKEIRTRRRNSSGWVTMAYSWPVPGTTHNSFVPMAERKMASKWRQGLIGAATGAPLPSVNRWRLVKHRRNERGSNLKSPLPVRRKLRCSSKNQSANAVNCRGF